MVFAYHSDQIDIDLRHETTHAILHSILPLVPLWLDEGLAEYFEVPAPQRRVGCPHLSGIQRKLRWRRTPRLDRLEQIGDLTGMTQDHYQSAWAWVHFMIHGPRTAHQELVRYLAEIQASSPPEPLSQRLPRRIPDLYGTFRHHFHQFS